MTNTNQSGELCPWDDGRRGQGALLYGYLITLIVAAVIYSHYLRSLLGVRHVLDLAFHLLCLCVVPSFATVQLLAGVAAMIAVGWRDDPVNLIVVDGDTESFSVVTGRDSRMLLYSALLPTRVFTWDLHLIQHLTLVLQTGTQSIPGRLRRYLALAIACMLSAGAARRTVVCNADEHSVLTAYRWSVFYAAATILISLRGSVPTFWGVSLGIKPLPSEDESTAAHWAMFFASWNSASMINQLLPLSWKYRHLDNPALNLFSRWSIGDSNILTLLLTAKGLLPISRPVHLAVNILVAIFLLQTVSSRVLDAIFGRNEWRRTPLEYLNWFVYAMVVCSLVFALVEELIFHYS